MHVAFSVAIRPDHCLGVLVKISWSMPSHGYSTVWIITHPKSAIVLIKFVWEKSNHSKVHPQYLQQGGYTDWQLYFTNLHVDPQQKTKNWKNPSTVTLFIRYTMPFHAATDRTPCTLTKRPMTTAQYRTRPTDRELVYHMNWIQRL